jgi:hypothetical protein
VGVIYFQVGVVACLLFGRSILANWLHGKIYSPAFYLTQQGLNQNPFGILPGKATIIIIMKIHVFIVDCFLSFTYGIK